MGNLKGGFLKSESFKGKGISSFLVGGLILLSAGLASAADLTVSDKDGVTYLKVDAPQGSDLDIKVVTNSKSSSKENLTLRKVGEVKGEERFVSLSDKEVIFDNVKVGTYTLTTSSNLLKVEEVTVVNDNIAKTEENSKNIEKAGYTLGGAALIGGIVAAGSEGGAFDSSGSGREGSVGREGDLGGSNQEGTAVNNGSTGSTVSTDPRVVPTFDIHRPTLTGTPRPAPSVIPTKRPPNPLATPTPFNPALNPSNAAQTPAPAPSDKDPMTPSN